MAATLTKAMLEDVSLGCACVKLVEQTYDITDTTFDNADEIYTESGTLSIDQAEDSKTEIKIDQGDQTIATTYEKGEFTITGKVPSTAIPLFEYFYSSASITSPTLTAGITGSDGTTKYKTAKGFDISGQRKKVTMFIESESRNTALIFTNVELVPTFTWGDVKTTPIGITFNGTVLAATKDKAPSLIILKQGE